MNAAQKAWATRRARAAAALMATSAIVAPAIAPVAPVVISSGDELAAIYAAKETARAARIAEAADALTFKPATELQVVTYWVDSAAVGCGERLFVLIARSGREVQLLDPCKLISITADAKNFDKYAKPLRRGQFKRERIATTIRAARDLADRLNAEAGSMKMADGGADAVRALQLLEG